MSEELQSEKMDMSPTVGELAKALCKAQGKMTHAIREANNPFFRSKYADLASVVEASRPALVANGLSVVQYTQGKTLFTIEEDEVAPVIDLGALDKDAATAAFLKIEVGE